MKFSIWDLMRGDEYYWTVNKQNVLKRSNMIWGGMGQFRKKLWTQAHPGIVNGVDFFNTNY